MLDNEMIFTAEDSMETIYLRHIFRGKVKITENVKRSRNGFYITNEVEVSVTLKREVEENHD